MRWGLSRLGSSREDHVALDVPSKGAQVLRAVSLSDPEILGREHGCSVVESQSRYSAIERGLRP